LVTTPSAAKWYGTDGGVPSTQKIEIALPTNYVRKDEFSDGVKEIKEMLGKIFDRLDNKADK
jgi:hypothetical protein